MTDTTFKVAQLVFDENEDVTEVVAKLDAKTCRVASELLGADLALEHDQDAATGVIPGSDAPGVRTVTTWETAFARIPRADAVRLFHAVGKINGLDPRDDVTHAVYESLRNVIAMLDDEW